MKTKKNVDGFTAILCCIIYAFFLGAGIFGIRNYSDELNEAEYYRENGGQTTATVTEARNYVERRYSGGKRSRAITLDYSDFTIEYTVDGEDYVKSYKREGGTYKKGETLTVYYLDSEPNGELRFRSEPQVAFYVAVGVVPALIGVIGITVTLVQYWRYRRYRKNFGDNFSGECDNG